MTYEEFLSYPWEDPHVEWVDGRVVGMAPVNVDHNDLTGFLMAALMTLIEAHDSGHLYHRPFQMKTGPGLPGRAPDVMVLLKGHASRARRDHLAGPADLVIEVTGPESERCDRVEKFAEYARGGVREYWILDPEGKRAEFYWRDKDGSFRVALPDDTGVYRSLVLPELWIDVAWLWDRPPVLDVMRTWGLV